MRTLIRSYHKMHSSSCASCVSSMGVYKCISMHLHLFVRDAPCTTLYMHTNTARGSMQVCTFHTINRTIYTYICNVLETLTHKFNNIFYTHWPVRICVHAFARIYYYIIIWYFMYFTVLVIKRFPAGTSWTTAEALLM